MTNVLDKLSDKIADVISKKYPDANEITLRCGKKIIVKTNNRYYAIDYIVNEEELRNIFQKMCEMSVYAYIDEIQNGFVTLKGGNRVGVCGRAVIKDGKLYNIKDICSLNIRIAREYVGCSDRLNFEIKNMLIISPPGCGKTTLLRDLCRRLGQFKKISVIDERGEIAGLGRDTTFNIGEMTDVMSLCDKKTGIELMLRSMSPDYIVTDEIADKDCECIKKAMTYGVYVIASAHGDDIDKTVDRIGMKKDMFDNIVLLSNRGSIGRIERIYGGNAND